MTADDNLRDELAAALDHHERRVCSWSGRDGLSYSQHIAEELLPVVERLQRQAAAKAVAEHHCGTCECIHEPCGYVIGTAGCNDYRDRADGIEAT